LQGSVHVVLGPAAAALADNLGAEVAAQSAG
jgi:hypothetical protein